jgi:hypothetical protein
MQDIWVSLHSINSKLTFSFVFGVDRFDHYRRPLHMMVFKRPCWVSLDTRHWWFEASLRLARLQGFLEVGSARLLQLCWEIRISLHFVWSRPWLRFLLFLEHQTSHATCFNARGLLYDSIFDALLFSSSYRPIGKPVYHHVVTWPSCPPWCSDTVRNQMLVSLRGGGCELGN